MTVHPLIKAKVTASLEKEVGKVEERTRLPWQDKPAGEEEVASETWNWYRWWIMGLVSGVFMTMMVTVLWIVVYGIYDDTPLPVRDNPIF